MLVWADNFNIYGGVDANMTNGIYSEASGFLSTDPDGVTTTKCLNLRGDAILRYALPDPNDVIGMACRVWMQILPTNTDNCPEIFAWRDGSNQGIARVIINTTGSVTLQRFDPLSGAFGEWFTVASSTGPVITANAWFHIEAKLVPGTSTDSTFELRVEGVTKLTASAFDAQTGTVSQIALRGNEDNIGGHFNMFIKDFVIWDDQGSANTTFLGACLVAELDPDGDVDIGGWVPSTGSVAWSILDNDPAATPYVSADNTPPAPMTMTQTNLPPDITSVKGIVTVVRASKVDGGDGNLQVSLISNGDESNGADRPITAAQTYWYDIHEVDPDTGVAWTPGGVDASTIKVDRTL